MLHDPHDVHLNEWSQHGLSSDPKLTQLAAATANWDRPFKVNKIPHTRKEALSMYYGQKLH